MLDCGDGLAAVNSYQFLSCKRLPFFIGTFPLYQKSQRQRIKKSGAGWLFPTPDFSISILVSFPENWSRCSRRLRSGFAGFSEVTSMSSQGLSPIIYSTVTGWNNITKFRSEELVRRSNYP